MLSLLIIYCFSIQLQEPQVSKYLINPGKDREVTFKLSEIAKDVKYVKLETNEKCTLGPIKKLLVDKQYIFISSHQGAVTRLFQFNENGNFLNEIGSSGRGPGQYSTALDFTLDRSKRVIYILDTMGKIYVYDYNGKFIKTVRLDTRPESILYANSALFLFSAWPDYYLNNGHGIVIKRLDDNMKDINLLNRNDLKVKSQPEAIAYGNYFYGTNKDDMVSFLESKFDTLYYIDKKFNIRPRVVLNLADKTPRELFTIDEYNNALKTCNSSFRYLVTRDYIFFTVMTPKAVSFFYRITISTGEVLKHNMKVDKTCILNDIDDGLSFYPQGVADADVLYSSLDCDLVKEHISKNKQHPGISNSVNFNNLNNLVQHTDYSDNPIIMLVTLN